MEIDQQYNLHQIILDEKLISKKNLSIFKSFSDEQLFNTLKNTFMFSDSFLLKLLAKYLNISFKEISTLIIDKRVNDLDLASLKKNRIVPVYKDNRGFCIAVDNPYSAGVRRLKEQYKEQLKIVLVCSEDINIFWKAENSCGSDSETDQTILDKLIGHAIQKGASDIHINNTKHKALIKLRINGELFDFCEYNNDKKKQLYSLLKLHSHMDISIFNVPQDGRITWSDGVKEYDIRSSSLPTVYGEDFVLRLFHTDKDYKNIDDLGFSEKRQQVIQEILGEESGLFLITGPTGSGKTSTLYAFLRYLLKEKRKNIVTLEDPVESVIDGVRQSQINPRIKYDFSNGLRSVLRQDPDVVMVGEIRDSETAKIALDAAYTGHLVLATLHTDNCRSTLFRLSSFGLDHFLIMNSLKGIISQKLVEKNCQQCKNSDGVYLKSDPSFYVGSGCKYCSYKGTDGRILLNEILAIEKGQYSEEIVKDILLMGSNNRYYSFEDDIKDKVAKGLISCCG